MLVVIPRNTTIPTSKTVCVTTVCDNQPKIALSIYEGERVRVKDNYWLGTMLLDISPQPRGVPIFRACFTLNESGTLHISVEETKTGGAEGLSMPDRIGSFSAEEVENMVRDAEKCKAAD
ncbi:heat shock cognate 70 kDa protein 2-like [Neltuma alba]|uniref:heat shock cognate 70 kDa protein 2-like n=1 Tax=Neltuma alba TaxID=207710 RepID=UPI0010A381B0|nr:heat shock cognate 70 kDa protein 2-like [Prosopis alba]